MYNILYRTKIKEDIIMPDTKHPINEAWEQYYQTLERIRKSGIANMWGAAPILARWEKITESLAKDVLMSWISNYDELKAKYGW